MPNASLSNKQLKANLEAIRIQDHIAYPGHGDSKNWAHLAPCGKLRQRQTSPQHSLNTLWQTSPLPEGIQKVGQLYTIRGDTGRAGANFTHVVGGRRKWFPPTSLKPKWLRTNPNHFGIGPSGNSLGINAPSTLRVIDIISIYMCIYTHIYIYFCSRCHLPISVLGDYHHESLWHDGQYGDKE